jgi:alkylation response protein AidB-like acyl-CoA dehydrogenase
VHEALKRRIAEQAAVGAAAGRLTDDVVAGLREAGLFKLYLPADLGGRGLGLSAACRAIAEVSEADPAAGWAVMIGAGPSWFAGHMSSELAAEIFGPADSCVAGSGSAGLARPAGDGWRISGRWRYCSGAPWSTWFTFNAVEDDGPAGPAAEAPPARRSGPGSPPPAFTFAVPAQDVTLHPETWEVRGMRATASWDVELRDVFVPASRTFRVDESAPVRAEPIFRVPFLTFAQATIASVSVGGARRLLRCFAELAGAKTAAFATDVLARDRVVADGYGRAAAEARAAAAYLDSAIAAGDPTDIGLAGNQAATVGAAVARFVWDAAGMSVLDEASTLGRAVLDLQAAAQNAVIAPARFAELGLALLAGEG